MGGKGEIINIISIIREQSTYLDVYLREKWQSTLCMQGSTNSLAIFFKQLCPFIFLGFV